MMAPLKETNQFIGWCR